MAISSHPEVERDSLRRFLDGAHEPVRERVRALLSESRFARVEGLDRDQYREQVLEWLRALAGEGVVLYGFPSRYGGGDDVGASIAAFETLAFSDLSLLVKCGVQFGLFGGAVLHLGTERHHERFLSDICSLELPGCFAMSETGHGSDVQSLRTTATYEAESDEFVIDTPDEEARKDYIGNAACHGRMAVVFAQLIADDETHGVHALIVPIRDEQGQPARGVEIEDDGDKVGLNGVDNGRLAFSQVRVPRDALLDRYGQINEEHHYYSPIENPNKRFFTMLGTLIQGRISVCGASVGAAKTALTIAVRYGNRRRQFTAPGSDDEVLLLDYRLHQRRLLPRLATTYALHFAQETLVAELDRAFGDDEEYSEEERRKLETRAAGIKAVASWHAVDTIQSCREACGGVGYLSANRFAALRADTDVFTTFEGDNTVLLQLVAKSLLTNYSNDFGELNPLETAAFLAGQVIETVAERSAAREIVQRLADDLIPGKDDEADLLDRETQLELFRWRAEHVLAGVARRLRSGFGDDDADPFVVFNECQDHVEAAARAHVDQVVLEAFVAALERCEDEGSRALLGRVCDLYATANIERDRAWFQEHARLSSTRSKGVTRTVNRLCGELRDQAELLVDAFGIPDALLGAPIALRDRPSGG
jgi:acyl-CoA oxidase